MRRVILSIALIVIGGCLGYLLSQAVSVPHDQAAVERKRGECMADHEKKLKDLRTSLGQEATDKRFKIAELRDSYSDAQTEMTDFGDGTGKRYPIPVEFVKRLRVKSTTKHRTLHDEVVTFLKISDKEEQAVNSILQAGWLHIAHEEVKNATVDATNPKQILIHVNVYREYGERVRNRMRQKVATVIGEQRMVVLFHLLDQHEWIMDYGKYSEKLRIWQKRKNKWASVSRRTGNNSIPSETFGQYYPLLPPEIQQRIKKEYRVLPPLTEPWELGNEK